MIVFIAIFGGVVTATVFIGMFMLMPGNTSEVRATFEDGAGDSQGSDLSPRG